VDVEAADAIRLCDEGLAAEIDHDAVLAAAPDGTSACDGFDPETYPGKRALNKRPGANMERALLCDGVAYEDVYDMLETKEGPARASSAPLVGQHAELGIGLAHTCHLIRTMPRTPL